MKKTVLLLIFLLMTFPAWGIIKELESDNADRDLTSIVTVLTDTPDASNPMICQGLIYLGDGSKDLDGSGGVFELTITVGGQTVMPSPQEVQFSTAVRASVWTSQFPVPANAEVIIRVKSPNASDDDVDVTAYLYDVFPLNVASGTVLLRSATETQIDNIEADTSAYDTDIERAAAIWNALTASYGDPNTYGAAMEDVLEDTATTIPGLITAGGIGDGSVVVDHDYSGADALTYETAGGAGIDNGVIRAYLKSDYDAGNTGSEYIKATTRTDVNGRWTNQMNLDPATYTLYYFKQGAYSPSTQEVTVQ